MTLDGLCFVDNDFRGSGTVILEGTPNPFTTQYLVNNFAGEDADLDCQFAAWFETTEDRQLSNFTCVEVQVEECAADMVFDFNTTTEHMLNGTMELTSEGSSMGQGNASSTTDDDGIEVATSRAGGT